MTLKSVVGKDTESVFKIWRTVQSFVLREKVFTFVRFKKGFILTWFYNKIIKY
jgi:hypothetical protein